MRFLLLNSSLAEPDLPCSDPSGSGLCASEALAPHLPHRPVSPRCVRRHLLAGGALQGLLPGLLLLALGPWSPQRALSSSSGLQGNEVSFGGRRAGKEGGIEGRPLPQGSAQPPAFRGVFPGEGLGRALWVEPGPLLSPWGREPAAD